MFSRKRVWLFSIFLIPLLKTATSLLSFCCSVFKFVCLVTSSTICSGISMATPLWSRYFPRKFLVSLCAKFRKSILSLSSIASIMIALSSSVIYSCSFLFFFNPVRIGSLKSSDAFSSTTNSTFWFGSSENSYLQKLVVVFIELSVVNIC